VDILEPSFAAIDNRIAVHQGCSTFSQGFHLGAGQHQASLDFVLYKVIVASLTVCGYRFLTAFAWHVSS
jgi:hypothetical protein